METKGQRITREQLTIKLLKSKEGGLEMKELKDSLWPAVHPVSSSNNLLTIIANLRKKGHRIERFSGYRLINKRR